ncbi:hypothetical protein [Mangrovimonas sp. TPBH4]|nr:hypothetical protein [Mangrovimonas sp. TPBH4]
MSKPKFRSDEEGNVFVNGVTRYIIFLWGATILLLKLKEGFYISEV